MADFQSPKPNVKLVSLLMELVFTLILLQVSMDKVQRIDKWFQIILTDINKRWNPHL